MPLEQQLAEGLANNWILVLAAWYVYRWLESEKRAREDQEHKRRDEERQARQEQQETTRSVVREELANHTREETAEVSRFRQEVRDGIATLTELVRGHEERLRHLEKE